MHYLKHLNNLSNLIMVSGFDKYFQIAPCFRDEDARADRSPGEFYQLDIEMAFIEQEDIFNLLENVLSTNVLKIFKKPIVKVPFPRITYFHWKNMELINQILEIH